MIEAWLTSRFKAWGPVVAAIVIVLAMAGMILLLISGLWWLRADAARDARTAAEFQCARDRLLANNEAIEEQSRIDREAADAAHQARQAWLEELAAARDRAVALEVLLTTRASRVVCYPRDVARELNR